MRQAKILFKDQEAGILTQHDNGWFTFRYFDTWISDSYKPAISLTFPKNKQEFNSAHLFPFFYNMLPEGSNKLIVCKLNRIDTDDHFGVLMATAKNDPVGAIRVVKIENS
jgi:serine/threonine-protein kinase HipA